MTSPKKAEPSLPTQFPGIIPAFSYAYVPGLTQAKVPASDSAKDDEDYEEGNAYIRLANSRFTEFRPLYCIGKFTDTRGLTCIAEGGVLWRSMYDFCGGITISSAWAKVIEPTKLRNDWGCAPYWKQVHLSPYGPKKFREQYINEHEPSNREKWLPYIPNMHAYCGDAPLTFNEALAIIQRSVAAAIIGTAYRNGRRGVFGADRVDGNCRTRDVMHTMPDVSVFFLDLPCANTWGKDGGVPVPHISANSYTEVRGVVNQIWAPVLYSSRAEFHGGAEYTNPNSGSRVAMASCVLGDYKGARGVDWDLSPEEASKFLHIPTWQYLLPHNIFHNG